MILVLIFLVLTGCGSADRTKPQDPPDHIDFIGASGIRVSFDADVPHDHPESLEQLFLGSESCLMQKGYIDSPVEGPVVRAVSFQPNGYDGWTDYSSGQITINASANMMWHETIHYVMWKTGQDSSHNSPAFDDCDTLAGADRVRIH